MPSTSNPAQITTPAELDVLSDDPVIAQVQPLFLQLLVQRSPARDLLDPSSAGDALDTGPVMSLLSIADQGGLDDLSVLLAARAISTVAPGGFGATIRLDLVEQQLDALTASGIVDRVATAIYAVEFKRQFAPLIPNLRLVLPPVPVPATPDPPEGLAAAYLDYVTLPGYRAQKVLAVAADPTASIHHTLLVTYKLMSLSDSAYRRAVAVYEAEGLPVFTSVWPGLVALDLYTPDLVSLVRVAVNEQTTTFDSGLDISPTSDIEPVMETVTTGPRVAAFISGQLDPRSLTTGQVPDNVTGGQVQ